MKKILVLFLFSQIAIYCMAQTEQKKLESLNFSSDYKYEVSTDLLGLIGKNELPKYTLQLKIHDIFKNKNGALRLKLGGDFWAQDSIFYDDEDDYNKDRNISFIFRTGYQIEKDMKHIQLYYGGDLHFSFNQKFKDGEVYFASNDTSFYRFVQVTTNNYQLGLIGFIGCTKRFTQNISLSFESSLLAYFNLKFYNDYHYEKGQPITPYSSYAKYTFNKFIFKTEPVSVINLNIHF